MKLHIGDKVRVINKNSPLCGKIGKIYRKGDEYDWIVRFNSKNSFAYNTSDLQLIKPVRKWKYGRKEITRAVADGIRRAVIIEMLQTKSEHTEDKSDMLSKKDIKWSAEKCQRLLDEDRKDRKSRPTLKPIVKMKQKFNQASWNYPEETEILVVGNPNKQKTDWEKSYDKKFGNNLELNEGMTGIAVEEYHSNATRKVKNFISKLLLTQRQQLISEIKMEMENYFGHILNDGSGKPMNISIEEVGYDIIKILENK